MADEAVNQVIADYYRDFSTLNVQAILSYFNEPSLLVGPQGVIPIPDRAALVAVFGPVMESLRGKQYGRSELELGYIKPLSSSAALIGGVAVRYKTDGRQLDRVGVTYVLHKTENGWKFATVILHDPDAPGGDKQ
jgi:ketosteroid isomerase-like protein